MLRLFGSLMVVLAVSCPIAMSALAHSKVRIAQQFGLSYFPLHVALELELIEKRAKELGEAETTIEVVRLTSGVAVNDAIISGNIDVAMGGLTVPLNLHDKTRGENSVKGIMAIADSPIAVIGRRHTLIVAYASARWRQASPQLYQSKMAYPTPWS